MYGLETNAMPVFTLHCPQLEMVWLGILLGREIVTTARNFLNYHKI